MQVLIDGPVYLELFVKVVPDWRSSRPARLLPWRSWVIGLPMNPRGSTVTRNAMPHG